jgi:5-hydroxyisourate hydrolase-like protein (transthyretin family)
VVKFLTNKDEVKKDDSPLRVKAGNISITKFDNGKQSLTFQISKFFKKKGADEGEFRNLSTYKHELRFLKDCIAQLEKLEGSEF